MPVTQLRGVFVDGDERHNLYRFNADRQCWEFLDATGPWTPCASPLAGKDADAGAVVLRSMSFRACPIDTTSAIDARDAVRAILRAELYPETLPTPQEP